MSTDNIEEVAKNVNNTESITELAISAVGIATYFVSIFIFFFGFAILIGREIWVGFVTAGILSFYYLFWLSGKTVPTRIKIDQTQRILVVESIKLFRIRSHRCDILDLKCTYEWEIGVRGLKAKVLRISDNQGPILELIANQSGWSKQKINIVWDILRPKQGLGGVDNSNIRL